MPSPTLIGLERFLRREYGAAMGAYETLSRRYEALSRWPDASASLEALATAYKLSQATKRLEVLRELFFDVRFTRLAVEPHYFPPTDEIPVATVSDGR